MESTNLQNKPDSECQLDNITNTLREVVAVAITMLYDSHRDDVLSTFSDAELQTVLEATYHLRDTRVEHVYRKAFDMVLTGAGNGR